MYDTNERVAQVKERAARIQKKREKRMIRGLSTLCLALCCCLVGILGEVSGGFGSAAAVQGLNGATLLSERTGGYVLVAVVSFVTAVVFTLLCVKLRERKQKSDSDCSAAEGTARTQKWENENERCG